ncbi:MAG TPA: hypothetical protein VNG53_03825 [Bacteroidia bacterium]|nr:hypothetical protein [Bacteroidia bacterium]
MKKIIFAGLFLTINFGCTHETVFNTVVVNGRYSLQIPEYLSATADLVPHASLQYDNTEKEVYLVVIAESKKDMENYNLDYDLKTYYQNIVQQPFADSVQKEKITSPIIKQLNGAKIMETTLTGKVHGGLVSYKLAVVETATSFYQILTWTAANKLPKYGKDLQHIIDSFQEMPQKVEKKSTKIIINNT